MLPLFFATLRDEMRRDPPGTEGTLTDVRSDVVELPNLRLVLTPARGKKVEAPVMITVVQSGSKRRIRVAAGAQASIALDSSAGVPARAEITTKKPIFLGGPLRRVAARATLAVNSCRL